MTMHRFSKKSPFSSLADIAGKKITIMGLGLNGGGLAAVRFFSKYGAQILITDMKLKEDLQTTVCEIEQDSTINQANLTYVFGEHRLQDFTLCDVIIKNPGVKFDNNTYLAAAVKAGIAIETDISLFLRFSNSPLIAVTGSKGKSTTASAIHFGLEKAGFTAFLGGNITVSPLTFLEKTTETTPVILELSSWQLADLRGRGILKPKIAVITLIVPDHQNWYGSMESYVADKKLIYADQGQSDYTICNYQDDWGQVFAKETSATVFWYANNPSALQNEDFAGIFLDEKKSAWIKNPQKPPIFVLKEKLAVRGEHLRENLLSAALVMHILDVPASKIANILADFSGIAHRLEYFHCWKSPLSKKAIHFYNDSAATVPQACIAAVNAFENPILICGGTDKNLDFVPFEKDFCKAKAIYLLAGTATDKLLPLLQKNNIIPVGIFSSLDELLHNLKENLIDCTNCANNSQIEYVVFSPGATSFGMFKNEFERGKLFKKLVSEIF